MAVAGGMLPALPRALATEGERERLLSSNGVNSYDVGKNAVVNLIII